MNYEEFIYNNRIKVNKSLNVALMFCVIAGPIIGVGVIAGIFPEIQLSSCIAVSVIMALITLIHYVLIRIKPASYITSFVGLISLSLLLVYMAHAHMGIYLSYFLIPLISLLFCDKYLYVGTVIINYIVMGISVWLIAPYEISIHNIEYDRAFDWWIARFGGYTIETVVMGLIGYILCSTICKYFHEMYTTQKELKNREIEISKQLVGLSKLLKISHIDELTRVGNRRAYEEELRKHDSIDITDDFVLISADVNGLKKINDTLGHSAGDELLVGAAQCLTSVIEERGSVYRTGGDEFMMILYYDQDMEQLKTRLEEACANWKGKTINGLTISIGWAKCVDYPKATILEMEKIADGMMYQNKASYYKTQGLDRRSK